MYHFNMRALAQAVLRKACSALYETFRIRACWKVV